MTFEEAKQAIYDIYHNNRPIAEGSEEHQTILNVCELAKVEFKKCNCRFVDRAFDTLAELMIFFKHNTQFNDCAYKMTRGMGFIVNAVYYTNKNLTNDVAEWLIENNPMASQHIKKVKGIEIAEEKANRSHGKREKDT